MDITPISTTSSNNKPTTVNRAGSTSGSFKINQSNWSSDNFLPGDMNGWFGALAQETGINFNPKSWDDNQIIQAQKIKEELQNKIEYFPIMKDVLEKALKYKVSEAEFLADAAKAMVGAKKKIDVHAAKAYLAWVDYTKHVTHLQSKTAKATQLIDAKYNALENLAEDELGRSLEYINHTERLGMADGAKRTELKKQRAQVVAEHRMQRRERSYLLRTGHLNPTVGR